jgi:hypothetical protein
MKLLQFDGPKSNQLNLFPDSPTVPSTSVVGLTVRLSKPCRCGRMTATVGSSKAMHAASLTCECGRHRGWLSQADKNSIDTAIDESSEGGGA